MSSIDRIVIVGAGLAGARAAEALRKDGYHGTITLLGEEPERPYLRPPLSKDYLRGESDRDAVYVHPEAFYAEHAIELRASTPVRAIEPASREIVLADGSRLGFDRLLLATGARPRRLPVPGADLPGVVSLRTLADADGLRGPAADGERIVVVGAGWIGSEVAASLRMLGRHVTLVAPEAVPLERVLGPEIGGVYRDLHAEHGVELRLGTTVRRIVGRERVNAVETAAGERIPADLIVVGIGVEPRTDLALAAGLAVGDGIDVSVTLETSALDIFAAGDVASAWHPFYGRRLRSEHWATAKFQGSAVARSMLGATTPYERIPYFYSDQYDLGMEYTGRADPSDRLVIRGSLADRQFVAFWLADGRVVAGMNANVWNVAKPIEHLIRSRVMVDLDALADPAVPLEAVAGQALPV
ncbi:MAG TPA: FAD-dependent oxidoreductase [Candidatus Limnocylindrales bacterium]|jgi:3-phenylpropionate/trans-cinnamate dioxygenase ferredoxin reductase subunit|nr:FAD-dependent oxidoreductase [Candidatus Limnocylindrales bacterium]